MDIKIISVTHTNEDVDYQIQWDETTFLSAITEGGTYVFTYTLVSSGSGLLASWNNTNTIAFPNGETYSATHTSSPGSSAFTKLEDETFAVYGVTPYPSGLPTSNVTVSDSLTIVVEKFEPKIVLTSNQHYHDIAETIRAKSHSTILYKPEEMASAINNITNSGEKDVRFIDYDGSIIIEYSALEFLNLTTMPTNPTHSGLISLGWNWSLADAQDYVENSGQLDIGQLYSTDDDKTRIYISLPQYSLSPSLGMITNGTATIEWGDGTTSNVTGVANTLVTTQHTYSNAGEYVISIYSTGDIRFMGNSSTGSQILYDSTNDTSSDVYRNSIQKVEFSNNVVAIGDYAFYNCHGLESVSINNNISTIGVSAFHFDTQLKCVIIPNGLTTIGTKAFYQTRNLKMVVMSKTVNSLGQHAFYWSGIQRVHLSEGINIIDEYVFSNTNIERITIPGSVSELAYSSFFNAYLLKDVVFSNGLKIIGEGAFESCYSLQQIILPNNITSIEEGAFYGCRGARIIQLPSGITSIPKNMASGCYGVSYIKVPNSVTEIATGAFKNCRSMKCLDFSTHAAVPTLSSTFADTFGTINNNCKIVVPDSLYNSWIAATNWSDGASYIIKNSSWS